VLRRELGEQRRDPLARLAPAGGEEDKEQAVGRAGLQLVELVVAAHLGDNSRSARGHTDQGKESSH
jgi:hypothetical protein